MKKILILTLAISLVVAGIALAGVISSKHDIRSTAWGSGKKTAINTTQVCVFCHHPHRGNSSTNSALLWNINDNLRSYPVYNGTTSSTMNTTSNNSGALNTTTAAAYSLLCMGCHDGSAQNTLIRGSMDGSFADGALLWAAGITTQANLGENLRDDHPVDFQYPTSGTAGLEDIKLPTGGAVVGNITSINYKLFNEGSVLTMQCATCHDVHNGGLGQTPAVQFMRGSTTYPVGAIAGSAICRDCHTAK